MSALIMAGILAMPATATADTTTGTSGATIAAERPCGFSQSNGVKYYRNCNSYDITVEVVYIGPIANDWICVPSGDTYANFHPWATLIVFDKRGC